MQTESVTPATALAFARKAAPAVLVAGMALLLVAGAWSVPAHALTRWNADGTAVSSVPGPDSAAAIVSLGSGRSAVVWAEGAATRRVRARILDVEGAPAISDTYLCSAAGSQASPVAIPDGAGGLIVAWEDSRNGDTDIYAQRMTGTGSLLWGSGGAAVCVATDEQLKPALAGYGTGGAIVAWEDHRAGAGPAIVYAQRVSPNATLTWTVNGVAVGKSAGPQLLPRIAPNGVSGIFACWDDASTGNPRVFAQSLDSAAVRLASDVDVTASVNGSSGLIAWDGGTGAFVVFNTSSPCRVQHVTAAGALWSVVGATTASVAAPLGLIPSSSDTVDVIFKYDQGPSAHNWSVAVRRVVSGNRLDSGPTDLDTLASDPTAVSVTNAGLGGCIVSEIGGKLTAARYADSRSASGTPVPQLVWASRAVIAATTPAQHHPVCVLDDRDELLVAWDDDRSGTTTPPNVFAQRFSPSGLAGGHRIVATAGAGGTTSPAGTFYVADLGNADVTLHSNATYHIASLAVNGVNLGSRPNYRFHGVQYDSTLAAAFATGRVSAGPTTTAGKFSAFAWSSPAQNAAEFEATFVAPNNVVWRLGHWNPALGTAGAYAEAGGTLDSLRLGLGYWLVTRDPVVKDTLQLVAPEQDYGLTLGHPSVDAPAWNQVGNPFRFAISDSDLAVKHSGTTTNFLSVSNTYTAPTLTGWDPVAQQYQTVHRMEPGQAYWVHYLAGGTVQLVFPFHAASNGYDPTPPGPVPAGADWGITVTAERAGMAPGQLVVGTAAVAPDQWNRFCGARLPKPPMAACDVYVSHGAWGRESGDYVADFAAPAPLQSWELRVAADGALAPGTLTFSFHGVPSGARVRIVDGANGWARDVADGERVELALGDAPRTLRLEVATGAGVTLSVPGARPVFRCAAPSPFADRTALVFALAERSEFALEIFDVGGRRVHAAPRGVFPAGEHVEVWDGRADDGHRVSPGVYLARWRAGGTAGTARLVRIP